MSERELLQELSVFSCAFGPEYAYAPSGGWMCATSAQRLQSLHSTRRNGAIGTETCLSRHQPCQLLGYPAISIVRGISEKRLPVMIYRKTWKATSHEAKSSLVLELRVTWPARHRGIRRSVGRSGAAAMGSITGGLSVHPDNHTSSSRA